MSPADTREALLDAAAALLFEGGLGEATTQKVARRAGVAEGTIYRHFASKEAFVEAVFARAWARLEESLEARLPPKENPDARLRAYFGEALAIMHAHPQESTLLRHEFSYLVARAKDGCPVTAGSQRFIAILEEAIRLAQKAGKARKNIDPAISAAFIYNGISKTWATASPDVDRTLLFSNIQSLLDAALFA